MTDALAVAEIRETLQGESSYAGLSCLLVRLAGCPLRCSYCDTAWAREAQGTLLPIAQIVERAGRASRHHVLVTGGEPLYQAGSTDLLAALCDRGAEVLLETSGAFSIAHVDPRVRVVMDVKCPGSGMHEQMHWPNLKRLRERDEVKLVLCDRADYEHALEVVRSHRLESTTQVVLSPAHGRLSPSQLARWILEDGVRARLGLQLHKLAWPDLG